MGKTRLTVIVVAAITMVLTLPACTVPPRPVYRAEVQGEPAFWQQGQRLVTRDAAGLELTAGFAHHAGRRLAFDVAVFNASQEVLEIQPSQFSLRDSALAWVLVAHDPEQELLDLDRSASQARARRQSREQTDLLLGTMDLALDLADPPDSDEEAQTREETRQTEALERAERARRAERSRGSLNGLREMWSHEALRHSTLEPGMTVVGRVFFGEPVHGGAARLVLDMGSRRLELPVSVVKHEVGAAGSRSRRRDETSPR